MVLVCPNVCGEEPPVNTPRAGYRNGSTPTVLLVHGAFAEGASWAGVIPELQAAGMDVVAVANPLRGLAADAAYVAGIAGGIDAPVLLVGHSYGGAVITAAGARAGNVVGLVYVAGFAVDEGESALDVIGRCPQGRLISCLRPATFVNCRGEPAVELYVKSDLFREVLAADLPAPLATVMAATQRPIAAAALEDRCPAAAWRTRPSWYAIATADQALHPDAQRFIFQQLDGSVCHRLVIARRDEIAGDAILDHFWNSAGARTHHGSSACHGIEYRGSQPLGDRTHDEDVECLVD